MVGPGGVGVAETVEVGFVLFFGGEGDVGRPGAGDRDGGLRGGRLLGTLGFDPFAAFDVGGELGGSV